MTREIIVDSFAGFGGTSLGIKMATGRAPDIAINHDRAAIAVHAANHPLTRHYCEDAWKVDPVEACQGRPVGLMWLSPACQHHSRAKGGKPVDSKQRGLAWVACRWAKAVRPRELTLENVPEFESWGPLDRHGFPDKSKAGDTFRRFVARLERLGYAVEWRSMVAADYGAPTTRTRLFLVARCDGEPIVWPNPTHHNGGAEMSWAGAYRCIDWTIPGKPIAGRRKPLVLSTRRRIARGYLQHGHEGAYIIAYYGNERGGVSLREPMRTVTCKDRMALIKIDVGGALSAATMRMLQPRELARAQGFPDSYIIDHGIDPETGAWIPMTKTAQVQGIGNSVCPDLAAAIVSANYTANAIEVAA